MTYRPLHLILTALSFFSIAVPAIVVTHPPTIRHAPRLRLPPKRIVPQAVVPEVEPVEYVDLDPDDARAFNATVPFSTLPNPAARPFRFRGTPQDLARATDCLAAGTLYEAGDDTLGERAVAQVVLNRLRHPAFPKTVCGVVFDGQDRRTGCQFSFSCDGATARWKPTDAAWTRARDVAAAALSGAVYRPVGYATHYHTDWVVPYWQSSLDKITRVGTHLFFRWSGWWGTPPAFDRRPSEPEPVVAQLAAFSDAHRMGAALSEAEAALAEAAALTGTPPPPLAGDPDSFLVAIPKGVVAELLPAMASAACGERIRCKYAAWSDAAKTPTALPLEPAQISSMTFSYLRDRSAGVEKTLWNCQQVKRGDNAQCMKVQTLLTAAPAPAPVLIVDTRPVPELKGVRRAAPTPAPISPPSPAPTPPIRPTTG